MAQETTRPEPFALEANHLAEGVAGLGFVAMEAFKNAAAALFDPDHIIAHSAIQVAATGAAAEHAIHQEAIGILARWAPRGDALRRVVNLQRSATEFARIAEHGGRAAELMLAIPGCVEHEIHVTHERGADLLIGLVRQIYVALRGALVVATTQNRMIARRLVVEDAELGRMYHMLHTLLETAAATRPQRAQTVQYLLPMLAELRQIGTRVVVICEDWL